MAQPTDDPITTTLSDLSTYLGGLDPKARHIVAIVGAPGSGKSTFADAVADRLNAAEDGLAVVVPMDGFHYDDAALRDMDLAGRKGAPETFDAAGLVHLLGRLRARDEDWVTAPLFDRGREVSRAGALRVMVNTPLILVEGNYLLLDAKPWNALAPHFDETVFLDVPLPELERRLRARWTGYGLRSDEIDAKVEGNDLPNALRVIAESRPANWRVANYTTEDQPL